MCCRVVSVLRIQTTELIIKQPGFTLPRQQWSLVNRFRTGQGHCGACRKTWCLTDTDLCSCSETQTMSHIVESCPLTKLSSFTLLMLLLLPGLPTAGLNHIHKKKKNQAIVEIYFYILLELLYSW